MLALAAEPVVSFLWKKLRMPRGAAVGIGVSMTFVFFAMLVLALCAFAVRELRTAMPALESTLRSGAITAHELLVSLADRTPKAIRPMLRENVDNLFSDGTALMDRGLGYSLSLAGSVLSRVPDSALGLGTAILSGYMLSARLPAIRSWMEHNAVLRPVRIAWGRIKTAVGGWLRAQFKLMVLTFVVLAAGLTLLRIPFALFWALGIAFVDALPVLGTGAVMIPWSLLSFLQGDTAQAVGLLGTYITAALLRSAAEPRLLGHHLGLDPLVTLLALYTGYRLWGMVGLLLAPMLAVAVTQLLPSRRTDTQ